MSTATAPELGCNTPTAPGAVEDRIHDDDTELTDAGRAALLELHAAVLRRDR